MCRLPLLAQRDHPREVVRDLVLAVQVALPLLLGCILAAALDFSLVGIALIAVAVLAVALTRRRPILHLLRVAGAV